MKRLFISLLVTVILIGVSVNFSNKNTVASSGEEFFTVVIDAGHGGIDGGAVGKTTGITESTINLDIAKRLQAKFSECGINAILTRSTEAGLYGTLGKGFKLRDLNERVKITNNANADAFISIHMNKYSDSSRRGAQVFFREGDENAKLLADCLQQRFNAMETCPRKYAALKGDYYILNQTIVPAVICECGFLSNAEDEALLLQEEYRIQLAETIFNGTIDYFVQV